MTLVFQILVYPGLLSVGALTVLVLTALGRPWQGGRLGRIVWRALSGNGGLPHALSILLSGVTIVLLPWPASPVAPGFNQDIWRIWALTEASCLVALLPGLAARNQATLQAAQIGAAGRSMLWLVLLAGLSWQRAPALWIFGLCVVLSVLPLATSATQCCRSDAEEWCPATGALDMQVVLSIVLSAVFLEPIPGLPWWQQLAAILVLALTLASILPRLSKGFARWSAETMLRLCFWVVLPLAVLTLVGQQLLAG